VTVWLGLAHGQVTVEVQHDQHSRIARSGAQSLFACLGECCPSAIRNDDPFIGRNGMTEVQYNRVLEKNGFAKVRDRTMERREQQAALGKLLVAAGVHTAGAPGDSEARGHLVADPLCQVETPRDASCCGDPDGGLAMFPARTAKEVTAALSAERGNGQGHKFPKGVAPAGGCVGALYYIQIRVGRVCRRLRCVKGTHTCGWQFDAFLATGHG